MAVGKKKEDKRHGGREDREKEVKKSFVIVEEDSSDVGDKELKKQLDAFSSMKRHQ